jgi:hypothetical protein
MDDRENRRHQMFVRVRNFGTQHQADFALNSIGSQLFATLGGIVTQLDGHAAAQSSKGGSAKQGTTSRGVARQALRDDLEAINRTARAMAHDVPGITDKFRLPPPGNDQLLLNAARAIAADAVQFETQFIAHEMPADFLEDLNADIAALETAISEQSSGVGQRVAATTAIDTAIDDGVATVRKLDAVVKNKYADNPATLAEWASASHTERSPRHHSSPPIPTGGSGSTPPTPGGSAPPA